MGGIEVFCERIDLGEKTNGVMKRCLREKRDAARQRRGTIRTILSRVQPK